jgi:hypothetical protein
MNKRLIIALALIGLGRAACAEDSVTARWVTEDIVAGYSKQAYEKFISYALDRDTGAMGELVASGSATWLKKGTKVFLEGYGFMGPSRIRLAGRAQELWVSYDFLSKDPVQSAEEALRNAAENAEKLVKQQPLTGALSLVKLAPNRAPNQRWSGKGPGSPALSTSRPIACTR